MMAPAPLPPTGSRQGQDGGWTLTTAEGSLGCIQFVYLTSTTRIYGHVLKIYP